ncbi:helix-turn-helix domain-containing protein [Streptomyces sp. SBT349]|uniref:helix-turn-helix domain-containing protein n=1 Tax=Streptomyces sp. SBT349 TaxID=1580539 RepID=UPI0007C6698B|nr:helix-turn-helix transcriptional regulator [Streptomyces sp. SBT349]
MSQPRSGPTVALRLVAAELRAFREAAGLTVPRVAEAVGVHQVTIYRLEHAKHVPKPATVAYLLSLYGVPEREAERLLADLVAANNPGWWHEFRDVLPAHLTDVIDLESAATRIRLYAPGVVPDLLQTREYAGALLRMRFPSAQGEFVRRRVELLAARQRACFDRPHPLRLWAVIEEAALRRPVGSSDVMRDQIRHLEAVNARASSSIQIMPLASPPHLMADAGAAEVLRFDHPAVADRLVVRGLADATITGEVKAVQSYIQGLDQLALLAPPPRTPFPPIPLPNGDHS